MAAQRPNSHQVWLPKEKPFHTDDASLQTTIPTPPPLPPVFQQKESRIHPTIKYGKHNQHIAFTELVKSEVVPLGSSWTEWVKEKAMQTSEFIGEQSHRAKDLLSTTVANAESFVMDTAHHARDAVTTAEHFVVEQAHHATEWTLEKAHEAKESVVHTAESVVHSFQEPKSLYHILHPFGLQEGQLPTPPKFPEVYHYKPSKIRPFVKYGKGLEYITFTEALLCSVDKVDPDPDDPFVCAYVPFAELDKEKQLQYEPQLTLQSVVSC